MANHAEQGTLNQEYGNSWTRIKLLQFGEKCETTKGNASDDVLALWGYVLQALDNWSAEDVFSFLGFAFLLQ